MSHSKTPKTEVFIPRKTVINFKSDFGPKLLCHNLTFTGSDSCFYNCQFCFVEAMLSRTPGIKEALEKSGRSFQDTIIRRERPAEIARNQLLDRKGRPKYKNASDTRVIYASPLVDVAATIELAKETIQIARTILELTNWQIRLLSKSNLLPFIAKQLCDLNPAYKNRLIFGVSTGTLSDDLAKSFEQRTALVSKRIQSLHKLQDEGYRTFGMICPSLPQSDYVNFSRQMCEGIRVERCEHVWAEVMNARGKAFRQTFDALQQGGFAREAEDLRRVSTDSQAWEAYARETYLAHAQNIPAEKLRFLQYVTSKSASWWKGKPGAILLGKHGHGVKLKDERNSLAVAPLASQTVPAM
jgi:DNA repair photolyase